MKISLLPRGLFQFLHLPSFPAGQRRWLTSRRHSGRPERGRQPDREPNSGNYGGSEGIRRTRRTCDGVAKTCCSSPFRANSQLMRESCSEKVGIYLFFNHTLTEILCFMHKGPGLTTFTGFSPANFKRPIVILGPLNDIAMEKLAREMPDDYEVAGWFVLGCFDTPFLFLSIISLLFHLFSSSSILFKIFCVCCYISTEMVPRSGSADGGSTVIKLDTVRRIAEKVSSNIKVMFTVLFSVSVWYFLFDFLFFFFLSLPRISTLCWISLPLQWKGSTTSSTTRWFCS